MANSLQETKNIENPLTSVEVAYLCTSWLRGIEIIHYISQFSNFLDPPPSPCHSKCAIKMIPKLSIVKTFHSEAKSFMNDLLVSNFHRH